LEFRQGRSGNWEVTIERRKSKHIIKCRFLLIGVGKSGAEWILNQVAHMGIKSQPMPFYFGVRVETKRHVIENIMRLSYNPKFYVGQKGSVFVKTHCFAEGGVVIAYLYNDVRVVGGFSDDTDNTSFSILAEHYTLSPFRTLEYSSWMCRLVNRLGKNKVILQRLGDFRKFRVSRRIGVENNSVQPTLRDYALSDMSSFLPKTFSFSILDFIKRLDHLCPGLWDESTLIYGPASEWVVDRIPLNSEMETSRKNLYLIGDGSGATQGIVAAASTGLIAAQSVIRKIS